MYVVTASDGTDRDGCLVRFATQASIDPPRFLVCLSNKNRTTRIARRANALVVHPLRADQHRLAEHFGELTGDKVDKLATVEWHPGPGGAPILAGCDWFAGPVVARHPLGDHDGFLLAVGAGEMLADGQRLGFQHVSDMSPGHAAD